MPNLNHNNMAAEYIHTIKCITSSYFVGSTGKKIE